MVEFVVQKFFPAANSAALAKPFFALNPPLFQDYQREIRQVWKGYVGKQLDGARLDKTWGKPSVSLMFGRLSRDEFAYLKTLAGVCTIYCRNEDTNLFSSFSAKLGLVTAADFNKEGNAYVGVVATFIDLVEL